MICLNTANCLQRLNLSVRKWHFERKNIRMKNLLKIVCLATLFIFVACSPKSHEIWFKVSEDIQYSEFNDYMTKYEKRRGWYILELRDISRDNESSIFGPYYQSQYITEVKLPSSIRKIEKNAFRNCTGLKKINIPKTVTAIEERAFFNCSSLTSIEIPEGVTIIEERAFCSCDSLTRVVIPRSVEIIGEVAFSGCSSLTSLELPRVWKIGKYAFSGCSSLTSVKIPRDAEIGWGAFEYCENITNVEMIE